MQILAYIGYIILAVFILLLMITIHEFGHYIAGKILKFKINEFSIGFGPKLFSKKKKNGEVFSIRAIPLGGYCAFAGEDEIVPPDKGAVFTDGQTDANSSDGVNRANGLDGESACRAGGVIKFAGSITGTARESSLENDSKLKKFNDQPPWKRIIVLMAGGVFNLLSAVFFCFLFILIVGLPQPMVQSLALNETGDISYIQQLETGDVITHINGKDTNLTYLFSGTIDNSDGPDAAFEYALGQYSELGNEITLTVRKTNGKIEEIALKKQLVVRWIARVDENKNVVKDKDGNVIYDIAKDDDGNYIYDVKFGVSTGTYFNKSLKSALQYCVPLTGKMSWFVLKTLGQLLTGQLSCTNVTGPIGTVTSIAKNTRDYGYTNLLLMLPLIAANLGVFNLLPIPALDGSKIIFAFVEWIRKKPINRKVEGMIHAVGLLVLFGLVIILDISGIFLSCVG